jgi:hypothetical protein
MKNQDDDLFPAFLAFCLGQSRAGKAAQKRHWQLKVREVIHAEVDL